MICTNVNSVTISGVPCPQKCSGTLTTDRVPLEKNLNTLSIGHKGEYNFPLPLSELPAGLRYPLETCSPELTIRLIAEYLMDLLAVNDQNADLITHNPSRFHSQSIPNIDLLNYLIRFIKYEPAGNECFLGMFAYVDALCKLTPLHQWSTKQRARSLQNLNKGLAPLSSSFKRRKSSGGTTCYRPTTLPRLPIHLTSYTVNRLLITSMVVSMKFFSDIFYTNSHMAKVGGLPVAELNQLEVEFLLLADFTLNTPVEVLGQYGQFLLEYVAHKRLPPSHFDAESKRSIPTALGGFPNFCYSVYPTPPPQRNENDGWSLAPASNISGPVNCPPSVSSMSPSSFSSFSSSASLLQRGPTQHPSLGVAPSTPLRIGSPAVASLASTCGSASAESFVHCYNGTLNDSGYGSLGRQEPSPSVVSVSETLLTRETSCSSQKNEVTSAGGVCHPYLIPAASPQRSGTAGEHGIGELHRRHSLPTHQMPRQPQQIAPSSIDRDYITMINAFSGPRCNTGSSYKRFNSHSLGRSSQAPKTGYSLHSTGTRPHGRSATADIGGRSVVAEYQIHPYLPLTSVCDSPSVVYPRSTLQGAPLYRSNSIHGHRTSNSVAHKRGKIVFAGKDDRIVHSKQPSSEAYSSVVVPVVKKDFAIEEISASDCDVPPAVDEPLCFKSKPLSEKVISAADTPPKKSSSNDMIWSKLFFFL